MSALWPGASRRMEAMDIQLTKGSFMSEDSIFTSLHNAIASILGDQAPAQISPSDSLRRMGANSVDRAEILMCAMEELKLRVPMISFADAENLGDIVRILIAAERKAQ